MSGICVVRTQTENKKNMNTKTELSVKDVLDAIIPSFDEFKKQIDKYPDCFTIQYTHENGYIFICDLDCLEPLLDVQGQGI